MSDIYIHDYHCESEHQKSAQGTDIKPEWVVQEVPTTLQNK